MNSLANSGTYFHNNSEPIHRWFKYTQGFSHKFVNEVIVREGFTNSTVVD